MAASRSSCCCQVSRALSVTVDSNVSAVQFTGWSSSCILHFPEVIHDFHSLQTLSSRCSESGKLLWICISGQQRKLLQSSFCRRVWYLHVFVVPLWCTVGDSHSERVRWNKWADTCMKFSYYSGDTDWVHLTAEEIINYFNFI